MCGIAGIVHWDGQPIERNVLKRMADTLVHRGPDEEGFYFGGTKQRASVGLAHRRLSIIDLATGQQPLANEDESVWIVFNGEIYDYLPLKRELSGLGHRFRTNSDTEVIVHAYEEWGERCLERLNGMFAFAIWDQPRESLFLARDRLGKKPLYYSATDTSFVFGSELKALVACPGIDMRPDATAVADYFKYLYVPDPKSIFHGIRKLRPAHCLIADGSGVHERKYWDVNFQAVNGSSPEACTEELFELLARAVRERIVAEVPLGAFLSGGVDSSGVVALMARETARPVITCNVGFDDPDHDESRYAAEVARYLGTDHREYVVQCDFLDIVRRLPAMFDEPFADSSAVPTYVVSKMARQRVTVALSGDGGDEAFAGYEKYVKDRLEQRIGRVVPDLVLRFLRSAARGDALFARKLRTVASQAQRTPERAFYESNTFIDDKALSQLLSPALAREVKGYDASTYLVDHFLSCPADDHLSKMLYCDLKTYLPGDILTKVDRTSMANSLEVRAPLLDHRVIQFAASLPSRLKINRGRKKHILKQAFSKVLPAETFERRKHGFTVPLDAWFRRDLVPVAEDVFFAPATADILNVDTLRTLFDHHRQGRVSRGTTLWSALMFGLWYRGFIAGRLSGVRA